MHVEYFHNFVFNLLLTGILYAVQFPIEFNLSLMSLGVKNSGNKLVVPPANYLNNFYD
jgi:hypothetical protein